MDSRQPSSSRTARTIPAGSRQISPEQCSWCGLLAAISHTPAGNEMGTASARLGHPGLIPARLWLRSPAGRCRQAGRRVTGAFLGVKGSRVQIPQSRPFFEQLFPELGTEFGQLGTTCRSGRRLLCYVRGLLSGRQRSLVGRGGKRFRDLRQDGVEVRGSRGGGAYIPARLLRQIPAMFQNLVEHLRWR